ncbi:MAG: pyrrolo-quinoline quinone [Blastopirellula sp.]|nr:pyrrolo-quinoline quinone [Blastopirellula sp.]
MSFPTPRLMLSVFLLVATTLVCGASLRAENWPQWRGPQRDGISTEKNLPTEFSKSEHVAWRLPLSGPGGATPVVWGDRVFVTTVDGDQPFLVGVSTDGKLLWKRAVGSGNKKARGDEGNAASNSPSTDGKHVWAMFTSGDLACFTVDGEEVWQVNLQERFGQFKIAFGMTSTPVLDGNRLYLQLIHGEGNPKTREATIAALNAATGETVWKTGRPSEAHSENEHSYASPTIYRDKERAYLLTHGADYIVAHDLESGRELWRCGGLHPPSRYDPTLRFVSSPLAIPGMIVVPSAKRGVTLALKPDGKGDITEAANQRLWLHDVTPDVPSPLVVDDIVYLCRENGNLIALDRKTGEKLYEERTHRHRHRASPVYADGKIYLTARDGTISVVKHGREFELLATNQMDEELSASPAIANGKIYLRTFDALYAISK